MSHRPRRLITAVCAATLAAAGLFAGPPALAAPDPGSPVKVNQVAYVPGLAKVATLVSSSGSPVAWTLKNSSGTTVASGQTTVRGADTLSGDNVHLIDFTSYDTAGTGYVLSAGGSNSYPFDISADPVKRLRYDALAFFYHQRSGIAIDAQYVTSTYARPAGHLNVSPNQGDNNVPCRTSCGYTLDVRGGWYDAGDQGKYVVNGGIAAWQLLNIYERAISVAGADASALGDGKMAIPERANGIPDVLDEARWEVEFLLKMQVPDGRTNAGLVHHKIHDQNWTGLPTRPNQDSQPRLLSPVSTAATLNLAAVAAQAARIFRTIDPTFSARALAAAEKAYAAAKANPNRIADPNDGTGGGSYSDSTLTDEFYWAAAELYVTTGSATYRTDVTGSSLYKGAGFTKGYDWGWTAGLGDTTIALVSNGLPAADIAATRTAMTGFADRLLTQVATQGYPAPFATTNAAYYWGSNGQVANNADVLALAYDFTGQEKYRTGVFQTLDYLLGRNPLNQSYIAGYGEKAVRNVHHRFWANQNDGSLPIAPPGSFSGGPNAGLDDPIAQAQLAGCKSQKCFIDDIGAYSVNEVAINWNSGLAWLASWAAEKSGTTTPPDTTAPTTPGTPTASGITATSATLTWAASTDNVGVAGYEVVNASNIVVGTSATTSITLTGLSPSTAYALRVRAKDAASNTSSASAAVTFTTAASSDTSPPTTPGTPTASGITATSATLAWAASTDNVAVTGYEVINASNAVVATSTATSVALTGLTPSTGYALRVRAKDAAGNTSTASAAVTFTTPANGDTSPPTAPGTPTASGVTSTGVTLSWSASTDNVGVTGYDVVRVNGSTETVLAGPTGTSTALTGLTAATAYVFAVYAKDAAGNRSTRSGTVSVTTSGTSTGTCKVVNTGNDWGSGFTANLTITNTGTTTINGWTLKITYSGNQTLSSGWSATWSQSGQVVTGTNLSYNGTLAPGGSTNVGFNANYSGTNAAPAYTLNGAACTTS
ncbi:endoglucanase [Allocatelliglobosispora scoriae]|uniref:Endoglucanase n=1 Tax=Allocatelliglobosispora scoriae TaxID=643052 RepID=A0A841BMS4_9ACTN|nr:glycoside hydrolase family 9 protein [Allocatelliglobosispora scoriae]MBB5868273.1 endoglucanase [Allocatelliglobosispora scoriae]